jgi:hypothetical protein
METNIEKQKPLIGIIRIKKKSKKSRYFVVIRNFYNKIILKREFRTIEIARKEEQKLREKLAKAIDGDVILTLKLWILETLGED